MSTVRETVVRGSIGIFRGESGHQLGMAGPGQSMSPISSQSPSECKYHRQRKHIQLEWIGIARKVSLSRGVESPDCDFVDSCLQFDLVEGLGLGIEELV